MAKEITVLKVFVSSPDDVRDERICLEELIQEINMTWADSHAVRLELITWETHVLPGIGRDPQEVISKQIDDKYDIFIGILGKTFGTPTHRAGSGTEEEFRAAYKRYSMNPSELYVLLYFSNVKFNLDEIDPIQLAAVKKFKKEVSSKGVLYGTYKNFDNFKNMVRMHLSRIIQEWRKNLGTEAKVSTETSTLSKVRKREKGELINLEEDFEEGFIDLVESGIQNFDAVHDVSDRIVQVTQDLGEKMERSTKELESATTHGEPGNLRTIKSIVNRAAAEMEHYVSLMKNEIDLFGGNCSQGLYSYAKALMLLTEFELEEKEEIKILYEALEILSELKSEMVGAIKSITGMRETVAGLPRATTKFNQAKRNVTRMLDKFRGEIEEVNEQVEEVEENFKAIIAEIEKRSEKLD